MASRGKRSAGDRVLESKHVIGLFLLMLVFSGVFFTLGYVMGRNQYDGQVRAASKGMSATDSPVAARNSAPAKQGVETSESSEAASDPATATTNSDWEFYGSNKPATSEPRLDHAPVTSSSGTSAAPKALGAKVHVEPTAPAVVPVAPAKSGKNSMNAPFIPSGALVLQVAALKRQDDALAIASTLQKKHYLAYVQPPQKDNFYRVQVGPFKDQKSGDAAKKGLESEGFKAFYVKH
jgi:cell division septation protein DedD